MSCAILTVKPLTVKPGNSSIILSYSGAPVITVWLVIATLSKMNLE